MLTPVSSCCPDKGAYNNNYNIVYRCCVYKNKTDTKCSQQSANVLSGAL